MTNEARSPSTTSTRASGTAAPVAPPEQGTHHHSAAAHALTAHEHTLQQQRHAMHEQMQQLEQYYLQRLPQQHPQALVVAPPVDPLEREAWRQLQQRRHPRTQRHLAHTFPRLLLARRVRHEALRRRRRRQQYSSAQLGALQQQQQLERQQHFGSGSSGSCHSSICRSSRCSGRTTRSHEVPQQVQQGECRRPMLELGVMKPTWVLQGSSRQCRLLFSPQAVFPFGRHGMDLTEDTPEGHTLKRSRTSI